MAGLDFGDNDQEAILILKQKVSTLWTDSYGNGRPGLFSRIIKFMDTSEAIEQDRHKSNTIRLNIIIALSALASAILVGIGIWIGMSHSQHTKIDPSLIFHGQMIPQQYDALEQLPPQVATAP